MPGTVFKQLHKKGEGHGIRQHKHAASSRLTCYYYASFHSGWHPEKVESPKKKRLGGKARIKQRKDKRK